MRTLPLYLFLLLLSALSSYADGCTDLKRAFEKEEAAYDTVARIAIASNAASAIIGRFVNEGESLLQICPNVYSLDRQYTLKRKLAKARQQRGSYRVFSQSEVSRYAREHPEEIIVYKWGTIRPLP